jgi:septum formation protein
MILFSAACVKTLLNAPFGTIGTTPAPLMKLVLASTSAYRRELLQRFGLPFDVARPDLDESPLPDEAPWATAERLAVEKARAVAGQFKDALIIGSDQVAYMDNDRFGKPGTVERAIAQLKSMSGRTVIFHTALAVLNTRSGHIQVDAVPTEVRFRTLTDDEIVRYVEKERPLDCAGSAKSEGLGITLLDALRGDDPNALVGLPLIALARMLRNEGVVLP